jgi:transcriptional regulator with XRE-family HTH domain
MLPESEIGRNIRKMRNERKYTLEDLSTKTGYSRGYLSKVENSDKAPPVSTLVNIASALEVAISQILGEHPEAVPVSVVKKEERQLMARDGTAFGYSYETLAHKFTKKHMAPYILTIPENIEQHPLFQHEGEEMLMVIEGNLKFIIGDHEYILDEGDCVYFDSGLPHRGFCVGNTPVKCLIVIYTP